MGLYSDIAKNTSAIHSQLDSLPYLTRYQSTQFTLVDRHRHLAQLLPIYEAIESKMKSLNVINLLPNEFFELSDRAKELKADIAFMRKNFRYKQDDEILASTQEYVDAINNETSIARIFGHFLVRILGDLHGGQSTKKHVREIFERNRFDVNPESSEGIQFYTFKENTLIKLIGWLNQTAFENTKEILLACDDSFKKHIAIFNELEATRAVSVSEHIASFFAKPKVQAATALAMTSIGLAALYARNV